MSEDLIKREDAIKAMEQRYEDILRTFKRKVKIGEKAIVLDMIGCVKNLPSADRPQGEGARLQMYDKVRDKINARYGSINKLAKIIGIEAGDLYAAFKGTKPMHPKYKRLISEALGESEDNLFNEEA